MRYVVTGGAGFFGSELIAYLSKQGHDVLSLDWLSTNGNWLPGANVAHCTFAQLDIRDPLSFQYALNSFGKVDGIFHTAALLAHDQEHVNDLWSVNVDGTRAVMDIACKNAIPKVIFISTNCVFSTGFAEPVDEDTPTHPIEIYGRSKLAAEEIITSYPDISSVIIRSPTIISAGRLGLLTILFDFVREGRRLYLVGNGSNRYSFIAACDLANACLLAVQSDIQGIYHIGSDEVPTMKELYTALINHSGQNKSARLYCLPEEPTMSVMKILNSLNLSPLGPYHYRMIAANFVFANTKLKNALGWYPILTNSQMLCEAYDYYVEHFQEIIAAQNVSAHKRPAKAGIINLLRMIS